MTMGALGVQSSPSGRLREGIVSTVLVFSFGYSVGWAPLTYLIGTEVPSPQKREHTLRFGYAVKPVMESDFETPPSFGNGHSLMGYYRFLVSFTYPYLEDNRTPAWEANWDSFTGLSLSCR